MTDFRYGEIFNNRLIPNFTRCTVRIIGLVVGIAHVGIGTASLVRQGSEILRTDSAPWTVKHVLC